MSVQSEFLPTLVDCIATFYDFEFKAKQVDLHAGKYTRRAIICEISIIELGTKLDMELTVSRQDLDLVLLSPIKGIESSASHVPVFANPVGRGYLNHDHTNFSERGASSLLRAIKDVVNIYKLAFLFPNTILTYYHFAFEKAKRLNMDAKFAHISPQSIDGREAYLFLEEAIKNNYGFKSFYPHNMLVSFQNIIKNNDNIFKPNLN